MFLCHAISEVSEQVDQKEIQLAQYLYVEVIFPVIANPVAYGLVEGIQIE